MVVLTSFKHFAGRAGLIQARSIARWRELGWHIVDFQNEARTPIEGVKRIVVEGDENVPPKFNQVAEWARRNCPDEICIYTNADILFEGNVELVVGSLPAADFLAIGQRTDTFPDGGSELHRPTGIDYFFFRGGMFGDLPETIVGRAYYDCALVNWALKKRVPVIDLTSVLTAIHQWHDYGHVKNGKEEVYEGDVAQTNKRNNGLPDFGPHIADATMAMLPTGRIVPNPRESWLRRRGHWQLWNVLTRGGLWRWI